jgi:hypothetical protein
MSILSIDLHSSRSTIRLSFHFQNVTYDIYCSKFRTGCNPHVLGRRPQPCVSSLQLDVGCPVVIAAAIPDAMLLPTDECFAQDQVSNLVILVVSFVISKKHEVLNFFLCVYINNIQCNLKPKITQNHSPHVQRCSLQTPLIQWFIIEKTSDIDITNKVQEQLKGLSQSRINMSGKLNVGLSNFLRINILNNWNL